jgi:transcriptional regulator with GAF, ATPase, and Fis domain
MIGESPAMARVATLIRLVAPRRSTVLLTGETGTGKEVVARCLHEASNRAAGPFIAVNCGAIPASLIESELFGHVKGAFTGAVANRPGVFEQACGGTIFLDEIGELPLDLQSKLLRVLQERQVQRLGSGQSVSVDVRVIAATNVNLATACANRQFREDLYYRLNVVPIQLPPLRERRSDIALLASHFVRKACREEGIEEKVLSPEALNRLIAHSWPGNVRQLGHAIETAVVLSGAAAELTADDFSMGEPEARNDAPSVQLPDEGLCFDTFISQIERVLLQKALHRTNGNRAKAADLLKLKRTTLLAKLKILDIDVAVAA